MGPGMPAGGENLGAVGASGGDGRDGQVSPQQRMEEKGTKDGGGGQTRVPLF